MSRSKAQVGISHYEAQVILDLATSHIAKNVSLDDHDQVRQLSVNHGEFKDLIATGTGFYLRLDRKKLFSDRQARELAQQIKWIQQRHEALKKHPHPTIPLQIRVMGFTDPTHWDCLTADPIITAIRELYVSEGTVHKPTERGYQKYVRQIIWDGLYAIEAIDGKPLSELYAPKVPVVRDESETKIDFQPPLTASLHSMKKLKRDIYAITQGLAHQHSQGFSHGDFTPNNILQSCKGQIIIIDPDDTKSLSYRGRRIWDTFSRYSPPEVLYKGRDDAPALLSDINGYLKGYPEAIDSYQLAMTAYYMVTGHDNVFKLPADDWGSPFWQNRLCERLSRFTTVESLDKWGYLDFSHPLFHHNDQIYPGTNPDGPLLKAWIMQGLTIDPDVRLQYSPEKLLAHEFFTRDAGALAKIKKFTSVNRDIAAIVGDSNSPLEDQPVVQQLAGRHGRLTRAAAVLYREARKHGHSKVVARSRAYPGYRQAIKSLSTKQKVAAAVAIVLGVAAIVAVNVVTVAAPILVATCVVGAAVIVGGVGVPLKNVRKQVKQADSSLRTAHRGVYVKFIDDKVHSKQRESKGMPQPSRNRRQSLPRCRLLRMGRPRPVPGMFVVNHDSYDNDSGGVTRPLLRRRSSPAAASCWRGANNLPDDEGELECKDEKPPVFKLA
ncbi:MAG: serine/threonine-protein kinase [Coxiellaceae bacterium]|nr:serine/threonine-protein kinase [Coxiellaceae bacterium]